MFLLQKALAEATGQTLDTYLPEINVSVEREIQTLNRSETPLGWNTPIKGSKSTKNQTSKIRSEQHPPKYIV